MADFFQFGKITTLHRLTERPLEAMEEELRRFAEKRPIGLIAQQCLAMKTDTSGRNHLRTPARTRTLFLQF
ncbi:MAG: hypothetical protein P8166_09385, partial [Candidatus Thiodiazotropha sp.]